jgi:endonuclease/exonuclease/phosphatase family metal-dependent hydrolase
MEYRVLSWPADGGDDTKIAVTSQGRIWTHLPFFAEDVRDAWKDVMMASSTPLSLAHRLNLSVGIARLAAVCVCRTAFAQCGLEVVRLALEIREAERDHSIVCLIRVWLRYASTSFFASVSLAPWLTRRGLLAHLGLWSRLMRCNARRCYSLRLASAATEL